jgi:hypothetical protein
VGAPASVERVQFACSYQQLQDLLAKLKDAQRQIQQLAQ